MSPRNQGDRPRRQPIVKDQPLLDTYLNFDFKYYPANPKYCLSSWTASDIKKALDRIKFLSNTPLQYLWDNMEDNHFHPVKWEDTREPNGFQVSELNDNFDEEQDYSVAIPDIGTGNKARMYGYLYGSTFYVIWFDRHHEVYSARKAAKKRKN